MTHQGNKYTFYTFPKEKKQYIKRHFLLAEPVSNMLTFSEETLGAEDCTGGLSLKHEQIWRVF